MPLANMTTGAAATSRCVRKYTAAATQNNTTQRKNIRRQSRRQSRNALEDVCRIARRVLGPTHPRTVRLESTLEDAALILKEKLAGMKVD